MRWEKTDLDKALKHNPAIKVAARSPHKQASPIVILQPSSAEHRNPKYWNVKVYVYHNGMVCEKKIESFGKPTAVYDSRREYARAVQLQRLERAGTIANLKRQVKFELETAGSYRGEKIRAENYVADFSYDENGELVVEDVKGYDAKTDKFRTTELFRSKWNRLKRRHPEYKFALIDPIANKAK